MLKRKILSCTVLCLLTILTIASALPIQADSQGPINFNPVPFENHKAPISGTVASYLRLARSPPSTMPSIGPQTSSLPKSVLADPTIIFNLDASPLPQNEETIAKSPSVPGTLVGGYNDFRIILAFINPAVQAGLSGFSISNDGGSSVRTDGDLPKLTLPITISPTLSGGDPAIDVSNTGTFYYSSLYYNFSTSRFPSCPKRAPCESAVVVFPSMQSSSLSSCLGTGCWGSPKLVVDTTFTIAPLGGVFNDKDWIAVDRTAQASGLYVTYTSFSFQTFSSTINMVRCSYDLVSCSAPSVISGPDLATQGSFVSVRTDGSIAVAYASFDLGVKIRGVQCSPGAGVTFTCAAPATIALVNDALSALSTEAFRATTLPALAVDYSTAHPNRVVVVWAECTTDGVHGDTFIILVCPQSIVRGAFTDSTTMAGAWTALNVTSNGLFPTVSIDSTKGTINIAYYSTANDPPWGHRLDLLVSQYFSGALTGNPSIVRVTATSDEPDGDPLLRDLFFGDYIQATATAGALYVSYTANYAQKGTPPSFNQDNYLSIIPD